MSDNFDGKRDTRLRPPCICWDIMKYDHLENVWFCEECGLDLERLEDSPMVVYDTCISTRVKQDAIVRTDNAPESPVLVTLEWALDEFSFRVNIGDEAKRMLKQQIGMAQGVQESRCWEQRIEE